MARTSIEIDGELLDRAMRMFGLCTKREAVHLALERLVGTGPMRVDEQLAMEGVGWDGDLDAMRTDRFAVWDSADG